MENPYQPPTTPPSEYADLGPVPPGEKRPTVVTVFGILNIVFGSLGLLCSPFALLFLFISPPQGPTPNPAIELMKDPGYRSITLGMGVIGIGAAGALLASGIGLLRLKHWGRSLSLAYACYGILACLISVVVNYVYIISPMVAAARGNANPDASGAAIGGAIGGVFGSILNLIYPILLLIFMTRPAVIRAFSEASTDRGEPPTLTPI